MSSGAARPQELICAVRQGADPVLELWFLGGRGSQRNPLEVQVLGRIDADALAPATEALEHLMARHGPWLTLDLFGVEFLDPEGPAMLDRLRRVAQQRGGLLSWRPTAVAPEPQASRPPPGVAPDDAGDAEPGPATAGPTHAVVLGSLVAGDTQVVRLAGELDAASRFELEAAVCRVAASGDGPIVLDLRDVSFIDCSVIGCFIRLRGHFAGSGRRMTLRNLLPNVRLVLDITGVIEDLTALAAPGPGGERSDRRRDEEARG